jgi:nucleoid DNA-binding protein
MRKQKGPHLSLALQIHEALDEPFDRHGEPALGYKIVNAIKAAITKALRRGEDVYVKGFGTFRVIERTPRRTGHNIVTGEPVFSPVPIAHRPRNIVIFIPSEPLKAMLNLDSPNYKERRSMETW